MARKAATTPSKNGRLEEALATLVTNQALLVAQNTRTDDRFARMEERFARTDERSARMDERMALAQAESARRFAGIENELGEIRAILRAHQQILEALPEAIRQKIGFESR